MKATPNEPTATQRIDAHLKAMTDWRGDTLRKIRALLHAIDKDIVEEWKWSIPVWSHDGIICTGEVYKSAVKMTFARGASLPDPAKLFTSSLDGKVRRAIDLKEGEWLNEKAFTALVKAAIKANQTAKK